MRRLIATFIMQKSIAYFNQREFPKLNLSPGFCWFILLATTQSERTQRAKFFPSRKVEVTQLSGQIDDESLEEKLETCKHFLVDSEMEIARHEGFSFAMDILGASIFGQILDAVFKKLKYKAKVNVSLSFVLKNVEDGTCR